MSRRILALFGAVLLGLVSAVGLTTACRVQAENGNTQPVAIMEPGQTPAVAPIKVVWDMLGQVDRDRALGDLRRITGEEPICAGTDCYTVTNRLTGSEGLRRATDHMSKELGSLGYSVEFRSWSRSGRSDRNLIARKPGTTAPGEEIYFVAHADGVKSGAADRFPAADDNGSGAVDLLETARVLSSYTFSRTLVLLFTTGEEQGTLGALSYLSQLTPEELGRIKYAVDVDVIGYDDNDDRVMELWHGGEAPSMAVTRMMSETIKAYQLDLTPQFAVGCG
jgi:Peptidase family M28